MGIHIYIYIYIYRVVNIYIYIYIYIVYGSIWYSSNWSVLSCHASYTILNVNAKCWNPALKSAQLVAVTLLMHTSAIPLPTHSWRLMGIRVLFCLIRVLTNRIIFICSLSLNLYKFKLYDYMNLWLYIIIFTYTCVRYFSTRWCFIPQGLSSDCKTSKSLRLSWYKFFKFGPKIKLDLKLEFQTIQSAG